MSLIKQVCLEDGAVKDLCPQLCLLYSNHFRVLFESKLVFVATEHGSGNCLFALCFSHSARFRGLHVHH